MRKHAGLPALGVVRTDPTYRAFSLLELLMVIAVMMLIIGFSAPAFNSIARGTNLNRAGQMVGDQLALARQEAVAKNREIEVRFYTLTNGVTAGVRSMQMWRVDAGPSGPITNASGRLQVLPEGVIINSSASLSPLLFAGGISGVTSLSSHGNVAYTSIRIRGDGSPDRSINVTNSFLTLQNASDTGNPPANCYVLQLSPVTGRIVTYRP